MADADRCVCCGEIVPEGRQVCPQCENGAEQNENKKTTYREELIDLIIKAKKLAPRQEASLITMPTTSVKRQNEH